MVFKFNYNIKASIFLILINLKKTIMGKNMPIPNYETIMHPLLIQISDSKKYTRRELSEKLSKHFNLSKNEEKTTLPSGRNMFNNRVGWANFHLKKAGLIENESKGVINITEEGLKALEKGIVNKKLLMQYPKYQKFCRNYKKKL